MLQMLNPCAIVYENVIKKYKHKSTEVDAQHVIHQRLKPRRGIGEPERHD
jgi:hypothetical protein